MGETEVITSVSALNGDSMANYSYEDLYTLNDDDLDSLFQSMPYPGSKNIWRENLTTFELTAKIFFYVLIFSVAIVGNTLVLVVLIKKKSMRNVTHMLIINLAISDILVTLFVPWIHLMDDIMVIWILGPFICKFEPFMQAVTFVSSVMTMTAIATERFFGIVMPFAFCSKKKEKVAIAVTTIWVFSIGFAIPPAVYTTEQKRQWMDHTEVSCDPVWPDDTGKSGQPVTLRQLYYTMLSVLLFFLPMTIMTFVYAAIIGKLQAQQSQMIELNNNPQKNKNSSRKRVVVMLIILLAVFMLCWIPFQISMLHYEYALHGQPTLPKGWDEFVYYSRYMADANSAFNPVIFICFSQKIRKAIFKLICKRSPLLRRSMTGSSRANSNRSSTKRTLV